MVTREQMRWLAERAIECARRLGVRPRAVWMIWLDELGLLDSLV